MIATSNFLIPNATFIVELVAFLIVLLVIGRYVLPFVRKALDERADKIAAALAAADAARADAQAADDERRGLIEEARQQAREIVAQANRTAEQMRTDATGRAQGEYDRILANANDEVQVARQRASEAEAARMGQIVLDVVERIIGREVDAASHADLINEAVAALRADAADGARA